MQVRQIVTAAALAIAAAGAMAQEIDPGETLQARSLAARRAQVESSQARTRESVAAQARESAAAQARETAASQARTSVSTQAREEQANRQIKAGELADALPVDAAPNIAWAKWHVTRPYGRSWLDGDRRQPSDLVVAARR
jgi:hypothetical protein